MSESKKNDGVPKLRIANKKGYVIVAAAFTVLFGGPIVDVVITATAPNGDRLALIERINDLEKTVHLLEHGIAGAKMCLPNMKLVYVVEVDEEDQFDEFLFE